MTTQIARAKAEGTWHGALTKDQPVAAARTAALVCDRLADPDQVALVIHQAATQSTHPMAWYGPSLAYGDAGLALAHATIGGPGRPRPEAVERAGAYLRLAVGDTRHVPLSGSGVSAGTAGLLVALDACTEVEPRWGPARDSYLADLRDLLLASPALTGPLPLSDSDYDLVNGRAGALAYLVARRDPSDGPAIARLVDDLLWVCGRDESPARQWRFRSEVGTSVSLAVKDPNTSDRMLNLSASHGAAGLLGALAAAAANGVEHPGLTQTLVNLTKWLRGLDTPDEHGPLWPVGVGLDTDHHELPAASPSSRTFGRFHDLLGDRAVDDLRSLAAMDAAARPDAISTSISYLPSSGHAANVTLVPKLHPHEIVINVGTSGSEADRLALEELSVGATESGFYLWSTRRGRRVTVSQSHMLNILSAPDVARLLLEVSNDGYLVPQGFSWLGLESHTRLPRVVRGGTVLRPAQWTFDAARVLEGHPPRSDAAREALKAWRARYGVPRWCHLVEEDNRLLLDLDEPAFLTSWPRRPPRPTPTRSSYRRCSPASAPGPCADRRATTTSPSSWSRWSTTVRARETSTRWSNMGASAVRSCGMPPVGAGPT